MTKKRLDSDENPSNAKSSSLSSDLNAEFY